MTTDPKSIEIHNLRNSLMNYMCALEEIARQKYADKCREIALKALASATVTKSAGGK